MATREEFLQSIWTDINGAMAEHWIDNSIREFQKSPTAPFADTGDALQRLLALGASRRDLALIYRQASYDSAFGLLYSLSDPGVDDNDVEMLHESLLSADPSGMDGRPGSAPLKTTQ